VCVCVCVCLFVCLRSVGHSFWPGWLVFGMRDHSVSTSRIVFTDF